MVYIVLRSTNDFLCANACFYAYTRKNSDKIQRRTWNIEHITIVFDVSFYREYNIKVGKESKYILYLSQTFKFIIYGGTTNEIRNYKR